MQLYEASCVRTEAGLCPMSPVPRLLGVSMKFSFSSRSTSLLRQAAKVGFSMLSFPTVVYPSPLGGLMMCFEIVFCAACYCAAPSCCPAGIFERGR